MAREKLPRNAFRRHPALIMLDSIYRHLGAPVIHCGRKKARCMSSHPTSSRPAVSTFRRRFASESVCHSITNNWHGDRHSQRNFVGAGYRQPSYRLTPNGNIQPTHIRNNSHILRQQQDRRRICFDDCRPLNALSGAQITEPEYSDFNPFIEIDTSRRRWIATPSLPIDDSAEVPPVCQLQQPRIDKYRLSIRQSIGVKLLMARFEGRFHIG